MSQARLSVSVWSSCFRQQVFDLFDQKEHSKAFSQSSASPLVPSPLIHIIVHHANASSPSGAVWRPFKCECLVFDRPSSAPCFVISSLFTTCFLTKLLACSPSTFLSRLTSIRRSLLHNALSTLLRYAGLSLRDVSNSSFHPVLLLI